MTERSEDGVWRRGVLAGVMVGALAVFAAVFVVWTIGTIGELRDDVEALEAARVPVADWRLDRPPPDPVMAAAAADVLSRAGALQGKGCEAQAAASAPGADAGGVRGRSVSAAEWLESTEPGS